MEKERIKKLVTEASSFYRKACSLKYSSPLTFEIEFFPNEETLLKSELQIRNLPTTNKWFLEFVQLRKKRMENPYLKFNEGHMKMEREMLFRAEKDTKEVFKLFSKAIETQKKIIDLQEKLKKTEPRNRYEGEPYYWIARCYHHLCKFADAIKYYRIAIKKNTFNAGSCKSYSEASKLKIQSLYGQQKNSELENKATQIRERLEKERKNKT